MYEVDLIGDVLVLITVISGAFALLSVIVKILEGRDGIKASPVRVADPVRGDIRRRDRNRGSLPHRVGSARERSRFVAANREEVAE